MYLLCFFLKTFLPIVGIITVRGDVVITVMVIIHRTFTASQAIPFSLVSYGPLKCIRLTVGRMSRGREHFSDVWQSKNHDDDDINNSGSISAY